MQAKAKVEVKLSVEDAKALRRLLAYDDVVISPSVARRIDNAIAAAIESVPYTENSVDFPTPGHVIPDITGTDRPHLVSTECECRPTLQSLTDHDGTQKKVWVHRKRNFTRWA